MEIRHLSYSTVDGYETCPRSVFYRKTIKTGFRPNGNMILGTVMHKATQDFVQSGARRVVRSPERLWLSFWSKRWAGNKNRNRLNAGERAQCECLGEAWCSDPVTAQLLSRIPVEDGSVEKHVKFYVEGVDVPIIGYVDLITAGVPVDIKTSSRAWKTERAAKSLQPTIYLAALEQMGVLPPDGGHTFWYYVFVKGAKPRFQSIETHRTPAQFKSMERRIKKVWVGISEDRFPCKNRSWKCNTSWCDWYNRCDKGESEMRGGF